MKKKGTTEEKVRNKPDTVVYAVFRGPGKLEVEIGVDGGKVGFLVDPGAGVSIIQQDYVRDRLGKLRKVEVALRSYS